MTDGMMMREVTARGVRSSWGSGIGRGAQGREGDRRRRRNVVT